ncbi:Malate dehydrogenase, cytoplasmic [Boothiomyces macroporosus]|uniref:malate dehydrogenase n=1 Tax=Boothiomyces macroporosus TaxID=261099 RepID=A0AAD5Y5P2_9FUNG|nr:Malate dehydrogenase, cytoplasmic [Boothiomyces macroporosus]
MAIISNPVNSTVPIVSEVFKKAGVYDPKRIFGVTTLDITRANTFVSQLKNTSPLETEVTVIGGHSGATIIPVLSTLSHSFSDSERDSLVNRIQFGGDEVVKAKNGAGSATLSMAFAGARFVSSLLNASVAKKAGVRECTFINTNVADGLEFFSTIVELGPNGVEKVHPIPKLSEYEQGLYNAAVPELKNSIQKGIEFDEGLPAHGNRQTLIKRHSNWILAFNANCDLKYPRPIKDIKKDFLKTEDQTIATPVFTSNAKHELTPVEQKQIQSHAEKYKEEFDMLIQQVQERKQRKALETREESEKENDKDENSQSELIEIE